MSYQNYLLCHFCGIKDIDFNEVSRSDLVEGAGWDTHISTDFSVQVCELVRSIERR